MTMRPIVPTKARLAFACPSYGPLDPQAVRSQRAAIMHAAANGYVWEGDASPDRMAWTVARNASVQASLRTDADYVCWCDSDVILPPHAFTSLLETGHDFVTGIYFQRNPPHFPLIAHYREDRDSFSWCIEWPENVVAPIDGCGFGVVITSTQMLRAMTDPWFMYRKFSEDFDFCVKAKAAGFQLYVHTGVICGHLADPIPIGLTDFRRIWAEADPKEFFDGPRMRSSDLPEDNSSEGAVPGGPQSDLQDTALLPGKV